MAVKQINKRIKKVNVPKKNIVKIIEQPVIVKEEVVETKKNKNSKKNNTMKLEEIAKAEELVNDMNKPQNVKIIKKERGLIERTESQKVILAEDNRQILND